MGGPRCSFNLREMVVMMLDEGDLDFELMTDESSAWPWRTHAF